MDGCWMIPLVFFFVVVVALLTIFLAGGDRFLKSTGQWQGWGRLPWVT